MQGPNNLLMLFKFLRVMPYIAIGLLIAAIVIWVIFIKKRSRWSRVLAIVITVLMLITGLLSLLPVMTGKNMPMANRPAEDGVFRNWEEGFPQQDNIENNRENLKNSSDLYGISVRAVI